MTKSHHGGNMSLIGEVGFCHGIFPPLICYNICIWFDVETIPDSIFSGPLDTSGSMILLLVPEIEGGYLSVKETEKKKEQDLEVLEYSSSWMMGLFSTVPCSTWLYLALPWSAMIYFTTDSHILPLTGDNSFTQFDVAHLLKQPRHLRHMKKVKVFHENVKICYC